VKVIRAAIAKLITEPIAAVVFYIGLRFAPVRYIHGLPVVIAAANTDEENESLWRRVTAALDMVEQYDPVALSRIRRDVTRVLITRVEGPAYAHERRSVLLPAGFLESRPLQKIAMTIAHEAAHARICRAGIGYRNDLRPRIERRCVESANAIGRKLPDAAGLIEENVRSLQAAPWTPAHKAEQYKKNLEALGYPRWLVRIASSLRHFGS
jgi:hypothetical protein